MIAKISTGADPRGLAAYLHGPGRETPHTFRTERGRLIAGGKVLCGTVAVTAKNPTRWGKDFARAARTNAKVVKSVWHCSLRCAPGDRRLRDEEFAAMAQTVAERMGFATHPWVAVRHDDDHIHLAVSRVDFVGRVWKNSQDRWRIVEVMRELERTHDLVQVAGPHRTTGRALSSGERRRAERTGQLAQRDVLREVVLAARDIAAGRGPEVFEAALADNTVGAAVRWRRNVASTGRMNGYSFHLAGHCDAGGEPIWWPASKLSRELSWAKLSAVLGGPEPDRRAAQTAVPKKRLERTARHEARRREAGQAQFAAGRWNQSRRRLSVLAARMQGSTGGQRKWQQVRAEMDQQQRLEEQAAAAAAAARAAMPVPVAQQLEVSQRRRQPWTPEMKRQYAIAKARAERDAQKAEHAKWTEVPGGGLRRDVPATRLRMFVSDDGTWSLARRSNPDQPVRSGHAATTAEACAQACTAAQQRLTQIWRQLPAEQRTEQSKSRVQRAWNSLTPAAPARCRRRPAPRPAHRAPAGRPPHHRRRTAAPTPTVTPGAACRHPPGTRGLPRRRCAPACHRGRRVRLGG
ncbi:relaxase/mobilization nuclease domain-containing protein [Rhodococcus ruber]|uniref:relaxase/mobilization nuclease domain-containing protein n=1 Tax=Rhodococcus ruber TaxID=1830 RepID=UPI001375D50B|nr:relaxase/mobilization nuclease domain-containing protein [Rhodococcus ruber]